MVKKIYRFCLQNESFIEQSKNDPFSPFEQDPFCFQPVSKIFLKWPVLRVAFKEFEHSISLDSGQEGTNSLCWYLLELQISMPLYPKRFQQ